MIVEPLAYVGQNIVEHSTFPRWWGWVLVAGWILVVLRAFRRWGLIGGIIPAIGGLLAWSFTHFAISMGVGLLLTAGAKKTEDYEPEPYTSLWTPPENPELSKSSEDYFLDFVQPLIDKQNATGDTSQ